MNYDQVREMQYVQGNIASLLKQLNVMSAGMGAPGMDMSAYGAMPGMTPADLAAAAAAAGVHPSGMPAYMPPPQPQQHFRSTAPMTPPPYAAMPGMPALSPSLPNSQFLQQQQQQRTPPQQQAPSQQARGLPRRAAHTPLAAARTTKPHSTRAALAELPLNGGGADASDEQPQRSPLKALIERERMQRLAAERLEVTESARLEMNIQNLNIRKHSQKAAEASSGTALSPGYPRTPQRGEHEHGGAACPKTCEREENADGTIKYDFSTGLPGGTCVYFMKGFCAIGNRCRYVHDETDEGAIVKVTGMPYTITVQNVVDFFAPLALSEENISFIMSKEGKQTGSAFVEFRNRKDALLALGKDRTFINEARFVLIYPSSKNERGWFVANPMPFSQHATPSVQRGGNGNGHHNGSNGNGGSADRSRKAASSPRVRTPAAASASAAAAAAAAAASAAALPVTPLSPHQMLQMQQALSPAAAVFNPALAAMQQQQQQQVAAAQHTAQKQLQKMVAGSAEEHKTPTPVKQLSFDESVCSLLLTHAHTQQTPQQEDKKDDTPSKRQEQLLSELARKLCSPNALRNLPEDQLTALLAVWWQQQRQQQHNNKTTTQTERWLLGGKEGTDHGRRERGSREGNCQAGPAAAGSPAPLQGCLMRQPQRIWMPQSKIPAITG